MSVTEKETMTARPKVLSEKLALATELSKNNGGLLPRPWVIIQEGGWALYKYIDRHPEPFKAFRREASVKKKEPSFNATIRNKHLTSAAEYHKRQGFIPEPQDVANSGDTKLASYMRRYPEVFKNLGKKLGRFRTNLNGKTKRGKRTKK